MSKLELRQASGDSIRSFVDLIESLGILEIYVSTCLNQVGIFWGRLFFIYDLCKAVIAECHDDEDSASINVNVSTIRGVINDARLLIADVTCKDTWISCIQRHDRNILKWKEIFIAIGDIFQHIGLQLPLSSGNYSLLNVLAEWRDNKRTRLLLKDMETYLVAEPSRNSIEQLRNIRQAIETIDNTVVSEKSVLRRIAFAARLKGSPTRDLLSIVELMNAADLSGRHDDGHSEKLTDGFGHSNCEIWNGAFVVAKRVEPTMFFDKLEGFKDASLIMQALFTDTVGAQYLHPFLGAASNAGICYILSPLAPLGSLYELLHSSLPSAERKKVTASIKASILADVAAALTYLHTKSIAHGRLKASNILLYEGYRARVSDYGIESMLTRECRSQRRGVDGARWLPPEVVQEEKAALDYQRDKSTSASTKKGKVSQAPSVVSAMLEGSPDGVKTVAAVYGPYTPPLIIPLSRDTYAFGCVVVCVLSMTARPFSNLPWEESVYSALLRGESPSIPGVYDDHAELSALEPVTNACLGPALTRPPLDEVFRVVDGLLRDLEYQKCAAKEEKQKKMLAEVMEETEKLNTKIAETRLLVSKGRELIAKKEADKDTIHAPKMRKDAETAIVKAKTKLSNFEAELAGMTSDLAGASADREKLKLRLAGTQRQIAGGPGGILAERDAVNPPTYDQQALVMRYCTAESRERVSRAISGADSLRQFVESSREPPATMRRLRESILLDTHADDPVETSGTSEADIADLVASFSVSSSSPSSGSGSGSVSNSSSSSSSSSSQSGSIGSAGGGSRGNSLSPSPTAIRSSLTPAVAMSTTTTTGSGPGTRAKGATGAVATRTAAAAAAGGDGGVSYARLSGSAQQSSQFLSGKESACPGQQRQHVLLVSSPWEIDSDEDADYVTQLIGPTPTVPAPAPAPPASAVPSATPTVSKSTPPPALKPTTSAPPTEISVATSYNGAVGQDDDDKDSDDD